MCDTKQVTKNAITLNGSATLITDYLNFGINSILYQRGIYPTESFTTQEHFGVTIYMSTDENIKIFLKNVLDQIKKWILQKKLQKLSVVVTDVRTKDVLERWDFKIEYSNDAINDKDEEPTSSKDIKIIQKEIRDVLRQISATISFLPLLDYQCAFDILPYVMKDCEVPELWDETQPAFIANSQDLQLRSFSTGLHKMDTCVSYRLE